MENNLLDKFIQNILSNIDGGDPGDSWSQLSERLDINDAPTSTEDLDFDDRIKSSLIDLNAVEMADWENFVSGLELAENIDNIDYKLISNEEKATDYSDLHLAINQLEASDRELVILNRFQEIKYEELAEIVGSTPGAVKTKVCRALRKLKTIYLANTKL